MRAHYDQVGLSRARRAQDAVEGIAANDQGLAGDLLQLRHCPDLLVEDAFGLSRFERDQIPRLVVVDHVNESQFRTVLLGQ
jgi:hypothetical protein